MKRTAAFRLCLALLGPVVFVSLCSAQPVAIKQDVLRQARQSYYNLRSEGLSTFQCSVTPDWELLLRKEKQANPESAGTAIKTLSQLQFTVNLAADNRVTLTHNELTGQNDQMKAALKQIYGGMEQMASGFFDTWNVFVLSRPFPEESSEYQLEAVGLQYKLSYKDGPADVVTTVGRKVENFAISDLRVTTPEFNSSIQP